VSQLTANQGVTVSELLLPWLATSEVKYNLASCLMILQ